MKRLQTIIPVLLFASPLSFALVGGALLHASQEHDQFEEKNGT